MHNPHKTLREWWDELDQDRQTILNRKREHASLVMPSLLPWQGRVSDSPLDVPYSSTPADGVNSLSSRIMGIILPLNGQPIFEIGDVAPFNPDQDDSDLKARLDLFSQYTMSMLAGTNIRPQLNLFTQHLQVVGDCMLEFDEDLNARLYRADQYVVRRKHEGEWVDILICEVIDPKLHPELQEYLSLPKVESKTTALRGNGQGCEWEFLYTYVSKDPKTKKVTKWQEFRDTKVGKEETFDVSPFAPARWKSIIGESYGISLIEDNFGDVRAIDVLEKALLDGVLLNSEYRWGVNPAGITELQDLLDSVNGDWVPAVQQDIFPLQFQNHSQVQATHQAVVHRESVLNRKFLKRTPRDAERVTATEIAADAQDLESQLGGVLSMLGREVQDPLIRWALYTLGKRKLIPPQISKEIERQGGAVKLSIKAGLEVLQRVAEREKIDGAIERVRNLPDQAQRVFRWENIARDWWESMGLPTSGRVKTSEELQQEDAQAQRQAAAQAAAVAAAQAPAQESSA